MQRRSVLIFSVLFAFIFAWWGGYRGLALLNQGPSASTSQGQTQNVRVRPGETAKTTPAHNSERTAEASAEAEFQVQGWKIDDTLKSPRACIIFTQKLDPENNLGIVDYLRLEPKTKIIVEIDKTRACVSGLSYDKDYKLTVLAGLKSAKGDKLSSDHTLEISFGNKPAHIAFAGKGVILPRIGAQGLAIETTNIDTLDITVYRVGDRMLARRAPSVGNVTNEGDYYYGGYRQSADEIREKIWDGQVDVKSLPNTVVTTVFPFQKVVGMLKPGAYIILAARPQKDDNDYKRARAWRWIIVTDLALTSYQSPSGLDVTVRSISTAQPAKAVKVKLVAENNEILSTVETDGQGRVHFDKEILRGTGPLSPRMLMAYGAGGDYAILDFNRSPLDLSAFNIGGRHVNGEIDSYMFADRGVYRPGETMHLTALLRDHKAIAVAARPGQLIVRKPNGQVFRKIRFKAEDIDKNGGGYLKAFVIPKSAARGMWRATLELDGLGQVGSTRFDVEDFVPQKLKVELKIDDKPLRNNEIRPIILSAQFLYGANGADLPGEAEARIKLDPKPFPALKNYHFGRVEQEFREEFVDLGGGSTDKEGLLSLDLSLKDKDFQTFSPLRAEITAGVSEPGGRYIKTSKFIPVRTQDAYIGIRPTFEDRPAINQPAEFNIKMVDWQGKPLSGDAEWRLYHEDYHYNWFRKNGRWQYRRDVADINIAQGKVQVDAIKGATISHAQDWGGYRLYIRDEKSGIEASYRFYVGWGGGEQTDAPDQISLGGPVEAVKGGQTVKLAVKSPYAGVGELVIADATVRSVQSVRIPEGRSDISVKLPKDIGAGVYALLSVYTPRSADKRPVPRRAVGISYIKADTSNQKLALNIVTPKITRPRHKQTARIRIKNVPAGENVWLTLAAIDEGVLQVTKYKSPDPIAWYFNKKAFPVSVRDDYARLLNPNLGDPAIARSGSDSLGGEGLTAAPIKVVSLYQGPVKVKNGHANISFDLPQFNGKLRLMAVAWSKTAVGGDVKGMIVRDPVPALVGLPRFLAPGDRAVASVSLDNVEGRPGVYKVKLTGEGVVSTSKTPNEIKLAKGERQTLKTDILSNETGISKVKLEVRGPGRYALQDSYDIQTRSPFMPVYKTVTAEMKPGEKYIPSPDLISNYTSGSTDINVSFSRVPGADPVAYATAVSRYPYGCSEQTVSAALPLLYARELGGVPGISPIKARQGIQEAVDRLVNRQSMDGSFGLWWAGDGYARPWLGVYVTDFLERAKDKGYVVPKSAVDKALKNLVTFTKMQKYPSLNYVFSYERDNIERRYARQAETAAYAHYVLARSGKGDLSAMRYFADNQAHKMRNGLAWAYLGAALDMMGDKDRANIAFKRALERVDLDVSHDYYQSPARDSAGLLALVKEVGADKYLKPAEEKFQKHLRAPDRLNTQAQAQVILAIRAFMKDSEPVHITAKGIKLNGTANIAKAHLYGKDLKSGPVFTNASKKPVWRSVLVSGSPKSAPPVTENGYQVRKRIVHMNGTAADLTNVHQGERFIVMVNFKSTYDRNSQAVLADLLPAGMEIEAIISAGDKAYPEGQEISNFQTAEMRDDRFVAADTIWGRGVKRAAYIVRAVTPGDYIWPGAVVEDMYRPGVQGITKAQRVVISADDKG